MEKVIEKIEAAVKTMAGRVEAIATVEGEVKSLDKAVLSIKAELAAITASVAALATGETKSLDGFAERLNGFEQRINRTAIDSAEATATAQKKAFDDFDALVRAGGEIELKSLDSGLKVQDVFLDDGPSVDFPLLGLAFFKTTTSDAPNYSYPVAGAVNKKGQSAGASGSRKKVAVTIDPIEYQPTLDREDIKDVGGQLFLDEQTAHVEGVREYVNAAIVDGIEAAIVASASVTDVYIQVEGFTTAVSQTVTDTEINTFIGNLATKYKAGSVFIANPAMAAILKNIRDDSGRSLWAESIAVGTPATFKGRPFIEDDNSADGRLIYGNPRRGACVIEREKSILDNVERSGGDYLPYYVARFGGRETDCRAWKVLDLKA